MEISDGTNVEVAYATVEEKRVKKMTPEEVTELINKLGLKKA